MANNPIKFFFGKALTLLRIRAVVAGLEVSDEAVRLVWFDGKVWRMYAVRLTLGVLLKGKVKDRAAFVAALTSLKANVGKGQEAKKMNVVVCMSSVEAYTQVFTLPITGGNDLDRAVALNLQMASPLEEGEACSDWRIVGRNENTLQTEILSAFMERKTVEEMVDALFEAGFLAMGAETKALALTRVLREKGVGMDATKPCLFVNIDGSGIDFLIIRNGALYFEYTTPWRDFMDEKGEVPIATFEASLTTSLRQVLNFYAQHWPEPMSTVILSAVALAEQAEKVIGANTSVPTVRLTLVMGQPISSEWLAALGSSLQETGRNASDRQINLLGDGLRDRFHEEHFLHFVHFWRIAVPITLGLIVLTFAVADMFLAGTRTDIESRSDFNLGAAQTGEAMTLQASAQTFNQFVALVAAAEGAQKPKSAVLDPLLAAAGTTGVTINSMSAAAFGEPVSLSGSAQSEDSVIDFKAALVGDRRFSAINLPLTGVQANGSNNVSFTVTFVFSP